MLQPLETTSFQDETFALKTCTKCGVRMPLSNFYREPRTKVGYRSRCKSCHANASKGWTKENADRAKDNQRSYIAKNKDRVRTWNVAACRKYRHTYPLKVKEQRARQRLLKRGHRVDAISYDAILARERAR